MNCEDCGCDPEEIFVVPAKKPDGGLSKFVCHQCALASGAYCRKHDIPHLGFDRAENGACKECIDELALENDFRAYELLKIILNNLPLSELVRLREWFNDIREITTDGDEACLLRALAIQAECNCLTIDEVVARAIEMQSVDSILPHGY
jgi:hypothetical protein